MDDFDSRVTRLFKENILNDKDNLAGIERPITVSGNNNSVIYGNAYITISESYYSAQQREAKLDANHSDLKREKGSRACVIENDDRVITDDEAEIIARLVHRFVFLSKDLHLSVPRSKTDVWGHLKRRYKYDTYRTMSFMQYKQIVYELEIITNKLRDGNLKVNPPTSRERICKYINLQREDVVKRRYINRYIRHMGKHEDFQNLELFSDIELDFLFEWTKSIK